MMASRSLPAAVSSACSVMETTRTPLRLSMDLKASPPKAPSLLARMLPFLRPVDGRRRGLRPR